MRSVRLPPSAHAPSLSNVHSLASDIAALLCGVTPPPSVGHCVGSSFTLVTYRGLAEEYVPAKLLESLNDASDDDDDDCDDDDDGDDESEEIRKKRMAEFEAFVTKSKLQNDQFKTDEVEAAVSDQKNDSKFERFSRFLNLNCEQVLRYQRSGTPLLATDRAPPPAEIPPCENCGAPRTFELQLMPHLLSLIDVDELGQSIDWASVYVFTCSRSCEIANQGYAKEYILKQDFS
ncbi:hypothetical protein Y032_0003g1239 [Ancylostoma ceylanicum]|uniref:Programmed cell death protein 2 C-terminal domain-containing protein n=1 Tax=Ancylostoma ceylanicum TaxID=53326 RepID=A0A016VYD6_9BILA|nr:hypothetical protein Y032_0003g1239 [Ancylostoma ceylanicum]